MEQQGALRGGGEVQRRASASEEQQGVVASVGYESNSSSRGIRVREAAERVEGEQ